MAQKPQFLLIDSKDRTSGLESEDFYIALPTPIEKVKSIKLKAVSLPISHYIIDETNNIFYFGGFQAIITPGTYDIADLQIELKLQIEATAYVGTVNVSYSYATQYISFDFTTAVSLDFSNTLNSIAQNLGFENIDYTSQLNHTSPYVINLHPVPYFYININELTNNVRSSNNDLATFVVFVTQISGQINYHFDKTNYECSTSHSPTSNLQYIHVQLKIRDNAPFTLRRANWQMLLQIQ
jgi:hypothetical protein